MPAFADPIAAAATSAVQDAATQVKTEGRAAIAAGGFGPKSAVFQRAQAGLAEFYVQNLKP